uniref:Uncharacterized protein n=1 Tax=Hippocampus comes TaxID=109280 RepID=A0A3Q2XYS7_HIPCM
MEALQNVINQSQGRDRLLRATQFASALCAHALRNHSRRKELVSKFKSLEANLSGGRKPTPNGDLCRGPRISTRPSPPRPLL